MNLYRKYRPTSFDGMFGNKEQIESLKKLITKEDKTQVFLFTGLQGVGKTTLARICAKELGSNTLNTIEINSANNRGIDTAREIEESCKMQTLVPRIFILDELHQTTVASQTAMLKILEDTPKNNYFFLCTTNPEKLSKPLRSRCTEIKLGTLSDKEMTSLLKDIIEKENKNISEEVLEEIILIAEGHPRQAIVLLEKIINLDSEKEMLKILDSDIIKENETEDTISLCKSLMFGDWGKVKSILSDLKKNNENPESLRRIILNYFCSVLLNNGDNKIANKMQWIEQPLYDEGTAWALFVMKCKAICEEG